MVVILSPNELVRIPYKLPCSAPSGAGQYGARIDRTVLLPKIAVLQQAQTLHSPTELVKRLDDLSVCAAEVAAQLLLLVKGVGQSFDDDVVSWCKDFLSSHGLLPSVSFPLGPFFEPYRRVVFRRH